MLLLPLVLDPQKSRNTEIQSNLKLSQDSDVTHKNQQEKNTKRMEKELGQLELPDWRKIQKTTQKCVILPKMQKLAFPGSFLDFS